MTIGHIGTTFPTQVSKEGRNVKGSEWNKAPKRSTYL